MTRRDQITVARIAGLLAVAALFGLAPTAEALTSPSTHLLLPYFELDLRQPSQRHLVSVGNYIDDPITAEVTIWSNWGIPVLDERIELDAHSIRTLELSRWLTTGELAQRVLDSNELAHVQAALLGKPSPIDGLIYAERLADGHAAGYLTIRLLSGTTTPSLWGEHLALDVSNGSNEGEPLVALDAQSGCSSLCSSHAVAFLELFKHDVQSKLVIWTGQRGQPIPSALRYKRLHANENDLEVQTTRSFESIIELHAHTEEGETIGENRMIIDSAQAIPVADLGLADRSGWLHIDTEVPTYIGVIHGAKGLFSANLRTFCLPKNESRDCDNEADVTIETSTNGQDADSAPGPSIPVSDAIEWTYDVVNTGAVALFDVVVDDKRGADVLCPDSQLEPGESMTCTAAGAARAGQFRTVGSVTATTFEECVVTDSDPSHYFGEVDEPSDPAIDVEKATNGEDADSPTGPVIPIGDPVTWTYVVTNTGDVDLFAVTVVDDMGVSVSCPTDELAVGETVTCTGSGTAQAGQYANLATATGTTSDGDRVTDSDPSHYFGEQTTTCGPCEGKIDHLSIRYLGTETALVRVTSKHGAENLVVFEGNVAPGGTFDLIGPQTGNPGFSGTLGTEVTFEIDGSFDTEIHTSCSQPVYPGMISGSIEVLEGSSSGGGNLCPV